MRTELCEGVEVPKAVWLTVKGASHKQQATDEESPISKVIGMAYKAWNLSCGILPKFVAHYQAGTESNTEAYISSHRTPVDFFESIERGDLDPRNHPPISTPIQQFQTDADATLQVAACKHTAERTLDLHILYDPRHHDQLGRSRRVIHIWNCFRQVQRYFAPARLTFALDRACVFPEVKIWLELVSSSCFTHGQGGVLHGRHSVVLIQPVLRFSLFRLQSYQTTYHHHSNSLQL